MRYRVSSVIPRPLLRKTVATLGAGVFLYSISARFPLTFPLRLPKFAKEIKILLEDLEDRISPFAKRGSSRRRHASQRTIYYSTAAAPAAAAASGTAGTAVATPVVCSSPAARLSTVRGGSRRKRRISRKTQEESFMSSMDDQVSLCLMSISNYQKGGEP